MKTYEIKMNRSRWNSLVIGVLCVAMIVVLCMPYFSYGTATTTFVPEIGDQEMLYGKTWVLSGSDESQEGYQKVDISKDGKKSTLYTTNILRVNQVNAVATFRAAVDNYNEIAAGVEAADIYVQQCEDKYEEIVALEQALAAKLGMTVEVEEVAEETTEEAAETTEETTEEATEETTEEVVEETLTPEEEAMQSVEKNVATALKKVTEAKKYYATGVSYLAIAKEAVEEAYEAVQEAFSVDAGFAWVKETTAAYNEAIREAYPTEYKAGYAVALDDEFKTLLGEEFPDELEEFKDAKKPLNKLYEKKMAELTDEEKEALYDKLMAQYGELEGDDETAACEATIAVLDTEMSNEQRDTLVYGKLDEMKAVSAAAAAKTTSAQKKTDNALKEGGPSKTGDKAKKDVDSIDKEIAKAQEVVDTYIVPEVTEEAEGEEAAEVEEKTYTATPVTEDFSAYITAVDELDASATEETLMATECTVKYSKGKVTFTFANGDVKETTYATSVAYDSEKKISILGYLGFPYNADEFTDDVAYVIKDYYINNVILLPICILVLALLGVAFAVVKKDSFGSGVCPTAMGLLGLIGYACSAFMKLGDAYTFHMIMYALILVAGGLQLYFGIKEKKAAKKQVETIVV